MRRAFGFVLIVGGLLMMSLPAGAAEVPVGGADVTGAPAPSAAFGSPTRVFGGQFWYGMDIGVDPGGHVHVVASGLHHGKAGLWYVTDRTGSWVGRRILAWSDGKAYIHPSLAVDARGRVHVAVERAGCVECTIAPAKGIFYLTDVGRKRGTFPSVPTRLTGKGTAQPSLRVVSGHVVLAYAGNPDLSLEPVRLRTDASGSWTTAIVAGGGTQPSLRIGMDGKPRVAFKAAGRLRYARASSLTGGFKVRAIGGTSAHDERPLLSIDEQGGAHVAWMDVASGDVRYSRLVSGSWTVPAQVDTATSHALSVDKPAKPWVVTGDSDVRAFRPVGGIFTGKPVAAAPAIDVTVKVLDSGRVVVAFAGGTPFGLWVSRT